MFGTFPVAVLVLGVLLPMRLTPSLCCALAASWDGAVSERGGGHSTAHSCGSLKFKSAKSVMACNGVINDS